MPEEINLNPLLEANKEVEHEVFIDDPEVRDPLEDEFDNEDQQLEEDGPAWIDPALENNPVARFEGFNVNRLEQIRRPNRGGAVVLDNDGRAIPQGINPPPRGRNLGIRRDPPPKLRKVVEYVAEGVFYKGYKFSRKLSIGEQVTLANYGYSELILKHPDLLFVEKEILVNNDEECIVVIAELADALATDCCKENIKCFDIKIHNKEYQTAYKKYLKLITSAKQNKNG